MKLFCESDGPKRDSGDDVGEKLIFDDRDLIAQAQSGTVSHIQSDMRE